MTEKILGCTLIGLLGIACCWLVLSTASRPADIERIEQTQEYKSAKVAHFTKWEVR